MSVRSNTRQGGKDLSERYQRAAALTGPKRAARTATGTPEGYWLDDQHYFFLAERFDSGLGHITVIPSILDIASDKISVLIEPQPLAALLARAADRPIPSQLLASAQYDMPSRDVLGITVDGLDCRVDMVKHTVLTIEPSLGRPALYAPDG